MRMIWIAAALVGLSACEMTPEGPRPETRFSSDVRNDLQDAYQTLPFEDGALHVVAPEHGSMRTYRLVPCGGGARICAGSAHGRAGHVSRGAEFYEVSGTYSGHTFFLSPGGDGYMRVFHRQVPIAWAADDGH
ncbi:hypothetical protein [Roseisalinus antarcticus]|uniref:Lipoprotein n=1 Tax=Roseisalinus antarcticus TaxID=254357 RepID=A0A1Y5SNG3_9RHOB|nr:hypothetical protein [Roseisalinus antarcticus]SLN43566.1 hypothetical protein ROA7023_01782 [Roseisalinus antarcticus]